LCRSGFLNRAATGDQNKTRPKPGKSLGTTAKSAGENTGHVRGPFPPPIIYAAETGGGYMVGFDDDARGPFESRAFAEGVAALERRP
jgi:hypothetical protein